MQGIRFIGMIAILATGLAGCNVTEQSLQPIPGEQQQVADTPSPGGFDPFAGAPGTAAAPPTQATVPQGQAPTQAALPAGQVRGQIRFMPVIGAPVNAVTPLSRQLAVEARNRGLAILSASDPGGEHVLKGYFSADSFDGQTTVFLPGQGCYRCVFPSPPPPGMVPNCAEAGVLGALTGTLGSLQATEVAKVILGIGEPLIGRLLLVDALSMEFRVVKTRRNPECPLCGDHPTVTELIDYEVFCGLVLPGQETGVAVH